MFLCLKISGAETKFNGLKVVVAEWFQNCTLMNKTERQYKL